MLGPSQNNSLTGERNSVRLGRSRRECDLTVGSGQIVALSIYPELARDDIAHGTLISELGIPSFLAARCSHARVRTLTGDSECNRAHVPLLFR